MDASRGVFQTGPMFSVSKTSAAISDPGSSVIATDPTPTGSTIKPKFHDPGHGPLNRCQGHRLRPFQSGTAIYADPGDMAPGESHTITFEVVVD